MSAPWFLDLRQHNRTLVARVAPENLRFTKQLGVMGPHDFDCEISLSATDPEGRVVVSPAFIGPYRTDFELRRADLAHPVMAGIITSFGGAGAGEEHVKISGKDWLHYLERRCWPYDATLSYVNWPDGFRFKATAAEIGQIVKDMLETIRDVSPAYPAAGTSYSLDFTVDVDNTGHSRNYEIGRFESQSIYDLIRDLASADKADGGFDFLMTWDKKFRLVYPELGDPDAPAISLEIDAATQMVNMLELGQTNTGPEGTHYLGVGAGTSTKQGGVNKHFRNNSRIFRRLDVVKDFGDVKDLDALEAFTSSALSMGANPLHEVPVKVDPSAIPGFWTKVRPGVYADVRYDLGYARLPNEVALPQRIVSMECDVDLDGNESVSLGLNQHFDISANAGLADW